MPTYVLKANRVENFYVVWSSIVGGPLCWGDRAEVWEFLTEQRDYMPNDPVHNPHARLDRADAHGSSALFPRLSAPEGGWDDDILCYNAGPGTQKGILRRYNLRTLCERFEVEDQSAVDVSDLLEPF